MEYVAVPLGSLVYMKRYYIVPLSRLIIHKLDTVKSILEERKGIILLQSGIMSTNGCSCLPIFDTIFNKDGGNAKRPLKRCFSDRFFEYEPTPITAICSTVSAADIKATIGHFGHTDTSVSVLSIDTITNADTNTNTNAPVKLTTAVKKTTNQLIETLRLGEGRLSIPAILKRKNTPQLENLTNRLLSRKHAPYILPQEYSLPPVTYLPTQFVNVYSSYGAIELLIESPDRFFDHLKKLEYIKILVNAGADPSNALTTAILYNNVYIVNLLLELGADPNHVSEYKTTDLTQRFLIAPLLATIPHKMTGVNDYYIIRDLTIIWENIKQIICQLVQRRTFIEQDEKLVLVADRNSLPEGTPVYDTAASITPRILSVFNERLIEHKVALEERPTIPNIDASWYNKYTDLLEWSLEYIKTESVNQAIWMFEPGGSAFQEARSRSYLH